jgi:hypothetical protein
MTIRVSWKQKSDVSDTFYVSIVSKYFASKLTRLSRKKDFAAFRGDYSVYGIDGNYF